MLDLLLFPFVLFWGMIGFFFGHLGRLLTVIIGLCLMIAGMVLVLTLVGAVFGVPLILLGFAFIVRSLF